ncbi:MAG: Gx transporter family protein [Lachnospiraceae bacterium]|nr:Gx transporter family protein [Lachnospiraceae bacterium]
MSPTVKTAYMGVFLALALVLSYVETLIPINFGIPGIKLGLTNILVLIMIYRFGCKEAFVVSVLRIVLVGFMFGNAFSIIYSLAGGILSWAVMCLLKKLNLFKIIAVSVFGGITHNLGQIIVAAVIVENINMFYYFPVLMISGILTGFLIGIVGGEIIIRTKTLFDKEV